MGRVEGRSTVYNNITSEEKMKQVNPENIELENDFLEYLQSIDRAASTIKQYKANLHVFWCWNLEFNKNKFFVDLTKREIAKFQNHCINEWHWSPKRVRTVKATMSSLSNFIEAILDDEYEGYRPIVRKIESPANETVREKSVFQDDDLQGLLDQLIERKDYMKACALSLAMNGGRRKSEIPRFKVSYFNDENLICSGALYKTPEKVTTKGRGSKGKLLDLYTLAKPFKPYLDMWLKEREKLGIESDWLFPKYKNGEWLDEQIDVSLMDSLAQTFSAKLKKPFYWHSMRHRFTTRLKEYGIPDSVIQDIVGWDSADMVKLYDDTPSEEQFEKYFGAEGIKQVQQNSLDNL